MNSQPRTGISVPLIDNLPDNAVVFRPLQRHGIKLHFGSSDVQTEIPEHFEKLKKVFQAANSKRMAIIVHMRASISKNRPYGPEQARAFLELLSFAPDIPVQIAHLASSGPGYMDPSAHSVIEVLADAIAKNDSRTRKVWFDVASNAHPFAVKNPQITQIKSLELCTLCFDLCLIDMASRPFLCNLRNLWIFISFPVDFGSRHSTYG